MIDRDIRLKGEQLLDDLHELGYEAEDDFDENDERFVQFKRHTILVTIKITKLDLEFDVYAELNSGIYEIGDLHLLTRKMLELKKLCLSYEAREINTTERLYPQNRRGKNTQTSGL